MRRRTPDTLARIQELHAKENYWEALFRSSTRKVHLLEEIGASGEISAIPDIVAFVLVDDRQIAEATAQAVHRLLSSASPDDLIWLDEQMRIRMVTAVYGLWYDLHPTRVESLTRFSAAAVSLLGLASFHANGYIREKAVHLLANVYDGHELPFLLIRANDWVPQVRSAALEAIKARLTSEYAAAFVKSLPLVERLLRSERDDHRALVSLIYGLLQRPDAREALHGGITSEDRQVRRISYRLALTAPGENIPELLQRVFREHDPIIHHIAAQHAAVIQESDVLRGILPVMVCDPFAPVRRAALQIIGERFPDLAHETLLTALLDTNAMIREVARYYIRRIESIDFAAFYRHALINSTGSRLLGAIHGIGETGVETDVKYLLPYAQQGTIRLRQTAIREIAHLQGERYCALFLDALVDAQPGVSNAGRDALMTRVARMDRIALAEVFHTSPYSHVRKNALLLLSRLGKWVSVSYFIRATCDGDERIVRLAKRLLRRWLLLYNRSFATPTPEQVAVVRKAYQECRTGLDEQERQMIDIALRNT